MRLTLRAHSTPSDSRRSAHARLTVVGVVLLSIVTGAPTGLARGANRLPPTRLRPRVQPTTVSLPIEEEPHAVLGHELADVEAGALRPRISKPCADPLLVGALDRQVVKGGNPVFEQHPAPLDGTALAGQEVDGVHLAEALVQRCIAPGLELEPVHRSVEGERLAVLGLLGQRLGQAGHEVERLAVVVDEPLEEELDPHVRELVEAGVRIEAAHVVFVVEDERAAALRLVVTGAAPARGGGLLRKEERERQRRRRQEHEGHEARPGLTPSGRAHRGSGRRRRS